jgi:hypothetical protein
VTTPRCTDCKAPAIYRVVRADGRDTRTCVCEHGAIVLRGKALLRRLTLAEYGMREKVG